MTTAHIRRGSSGGGRAARGAGWQSGWITFAAVMMIFGGILAVFEGIAAIARDNVFVSTGSYVYKFDLTSWGWIHLAIGVLVVLTGIALMGGAIWARIVGIFLAGLMMVANFMWIPYYPLWAIVLIAIDAFVIWALCTAGTRRSERA